MKPNIVLPERTVRFGLGMLLTASPVLELHTYPYNLLGPLLVASAVLGYCPLRAVLSVLTGRGNEPAGARPAASKA